MRANSVDDEKVFHVPRFVSVLCIPRNVLHMHSFQECGARCTLLN